MGKIFRNGNCTDSSHTKNQIAQGDWQKFLQDFPDWH